LLALGVGFTAVAERSRFLAYAPRKTRVVIMKPNLIIAALVVSALSTHALALDVKFADELWDGKTIPAGQQCQKFAGHNPATPRLIVSEIPAGSTAIVLAYSDRDVEAMNNGGHGIVRFTLNSPASTVQIPSVLGHTFDIPADFKMIKAHRGPGWDTAGAYMPPCSGGKGHAYYVTVKTMQGDNVTATAVLELGKY
jgi:hypothetical protein